MLYNKITGINVTQKGPSILVRVPCWTEERLTLSTRMAAIRMTKIKKNLTRLQSYSISYVFLRTIRKDVYDTNPKFSWSFIVTAYIVLIFQRSIIKNTLKMPYIITLFLVTDPDSTLYKCWFSLSLSGNEDEEFASLLACCDGFVSGIDRIAMMMLKQQRRSPV